MKIFSFIVAGLLLLLTTTRAQRFACDPCLDRSKFSIRAFGLGDASTSYWQQIEASMTQAASDMNVDFSLSLSSTANALASAVQGASADALIVDLIADNAVQDAVGAKIAAGTPVFGFEHGYETFRAAGVKAFVGVDQAQAGQQAADKLVEMHPKTTGLVTLFVTDDPAMSGELFSGFETSLQDSSNSSVTQIDTSELTASFAGCAVDAVLVADSALLGAVLDVMDDEGCDFDTTLVGVIGTNAAVHTALSQRKVAVVVDEQQYLSSALSVVLAALFSSTGQTLAPSSESVYGLQQAGPVLVDRDHLPSDSTVACQDQAFPVCAPQGSGTSSDNPEDADSTTCTCTDRKKIKLAGVLHAVTTDAFWDIVYSAMDQAAHDFGVDLEVDRFEPAEADVLYLKMATKIEKLCEDGAVDGIFVTIPNAAVHLAIELCLSLNIPVVSINAGPDFSKDLGLAHHIGMVEYNAGVGAGRRMAETGQMTRALCMMHVSNHTVLLDRCNGFEAGVAQGDPTIDYLGSIDVPEDNVERYVQIVEEAVGEDGPWTGLGLMLAGQPQGEAGLKLKELHADVLLGSFDTSDLHYEAIDEGKMLFTLDQGAYMQGYLPIPLLTWQASAKQMLQNHLVESGPAFITRAPDDSQQTCEADHFMSCDFESAEQSSSSDDNISNGGVIGLAVACAVLGVLVLYLVFRVHKLNAHVKQLRVEGKDTPDLQVQHYFRSLGSSVNKVVEPTESEAEPEVT